LANCIPIDTSGGKSGSDFFKSLDGLFIFKEVKESEFFMFDDSCPKYFEHMFKHTFEKNPSVLNKIYAMFDITSQITK